MIITAIIIAVAANGLAITTEPGMIFHRLSRYKFLGGCAACTAGSTMTILAMVAAQNINPFTWVFTSLMAVAIAEALERIIDSL